MKPSSHTIPFYAIIIFTIISFSNPFPSAAETSPPSAYEALQKYNFPAGLLPKGVTNYKLDRATGKFAAYLNNTCKYTIDNYELEYKSTISGVISKDRLRNLKGVSVKVLILWLNIVEVIRYEDEIQFSVGIASANFPVENFYESPQCGCGFDCDALLMMGGSLPSSS